MFDGGQEGVYRKLMACSAPTLQIEMKLEKRVVDGNRIVDRLEFPARRRSEKDQQVKMV